jgi:PhnB protein
MAERPNPMGVIPHLICRDAAAAIEFYKKAFGAEEMFRLPDKQGKLMHGSVSINGGMVMLMDEYPEHDAKSPLLHGGSAVILHIQVPDVDTAFQQAVDAGARPVVPPADQFWGDRYAQVDDPFGHRWSLATTIKAMTPDDIIKNVREMDQLA